jgi:hypothetical protein
VEKRRLVDHSTGYSAAKRFWKNVVSAAPMFSIFRPVTF